MTWKSRYAIMLMRDGRPVDIFHTDSVPPTIRVPKLAPITVTKISKSFPPFSPSLSYDEYKILQAHSPSRYLIAEYQSAGGEG